MYNEGGATNLLNVTLSGNQARVSGAGIYNAQTTGVKVMNSIIYDNRTIASQILPNIVNMAVGTEYSFCVIEGIDVPNAWNLLGTNAGDNHTGILYFAKPGFNTNGGMVAGDYRLKDVRSVQTMRDGIRRLLLPGAQRTWREGNESMTTGWISEHTNLFRKICRRLS